MVRGEGWQSKTDLGKGLCKMYSSDDFSSANTPHNVLRSESSPAGPRPWKPGPGDLGHPASLLGAASHSVLFSFSSQGDMGTLGPIGYPGPKGMKVNRAIPYPRPYPIQAPPDPFQPERKGVLT